MSTASDLSDRIADLAAHVGIRAAILALSCRSNAFRASRADLREAFEIHLDKGAKMAKTRL